MPEQLNLDEALRSFNEVLEQPNAPYSSEPVRVLYRLIDAARFTAEYPAIPTTIEGWHLHRVPGAGKIAQALAKAARPIVRAARYS